MAQPQPATQHETMNKASTPKQEEAPFRHPGKKPTILQVLPALENGGVERGTIEMARTLTRNGWKAIVASNGGSMVHELEKIGATHVDIPLHRKDPFSILNNQRLLAHLIRAANVDLVHARSRGPAWSAYMACKSSHTPFITTFHGHYSLGKPSLRPLKTMYNSVMAKGSPTIAISQFTADHISSTYHIDQQNMVIIPRGVDVDYFNPDSVKQGRWTQLAEQWRLPEDKPVLFMPARPSRWKGHELLIQALAGLPTRDFMCVMAGDDGKHDAFRKELEKLAMHHGLGPNLRIVPSVKDMPAAYTLSTLVLCPSTRPEAFGRVPCEAAAMGKPVIAAGHGGALETILDGRTGWLHTPNNAEDLRKKIVRVLSMEDAQLKGLAKTARQHAIDKFSIQSMCHSTMEVYDNILFA